LEQLRREFQANAQRNLFLTGELLRLLDLFEASGIPAIPYKGPALAAVLYHDLALRQFADLELLVHKPDLPRVEQLLLAQGYLPECRLSPGQQVAYMRTECEYNFVRRDTRVRLEIHWNIVPRYFTVPLEPQSFWARLEAVDLGPKQTVAFAPDMLLLILGVHHGAKHGWGRLGWICDLAQLIRVRPDLDWQAVWEQADRLGVRRVVLVGLLLARDLLGAALPEPVLGKIRADRPAARLAREVCEQLFVLPHRRPGKLAQRLLTLKLRERLRDRVGYCLRLALTPTEGDRELLALPPALASLYYLVRPIRLIGRYGLGRGPLNR
jgi:hypothetical protein